MGQHRRANRSKSPETRLKTTEETVVLLTRSQTGTVFLLLILISPNFRELFLSLFLCFFKKIFYLFIFREEKGGRKRGRKTLM